MQRHLARPAAGRVHRAAPTTRSGSARRPTPSSRAAPTAPHPLFRELIGAALDRRDARAGLRRCRSETPARSLRRRDRRRRAGFRRLGEREVHQGHVWRVVVADFEAPDGERFQRDIVRSPGAVGVVPLIFDAEGNAVGACSSSSTARRTSASVIEIPAGMRDVDGEPPEETGAPRAGRGGRPGGGPARSARSRSCRRRA